MDKKMMYIVVAVIVVVLIVGIAGVMLLNNNGNNGATNPTPTPAPSTPVSEASTLQFSVNETTGDVVIGYQYSCKDFNGTNEVVRVDMCMAEGNYSNIIDVGTMKSYASMDNGATWTETAFADDCTNYVVPFHALVDKIIANGDTNVDFSYTDGSKTVDIYCIAVNPTIADSVFATS